MVNLSLETLEQIIKKNAKLLMGFNIFDIAKINFF